MRNSPARHVFFAFLALWLGVSESIANPKEDVKEQAKAALTRAAELTDLKAQGSSPFHLSSRVQLSIRGPLDTQGTYVLDWESAERLRGEIAFPGFSEVEVASDGKLWRLRSLAYPPLRVWQLRELMDLKKELLFDLKKDVKKIRTSDKNGTHSLCIEFRRDPGSFTTCIDSATGAPLSIEEDSPVVKKRSEYSNYVTIGGKMYPQDMRYFEGEKQLVALHVEELNQASTINANLFSPLPGIDAQPWCSAPQPPRMLHFLAVHPNSPSRSDYDPSTNKGRVGLFATIGTDGRLKNLHIVQSVSPTLDAAVLKGAEEVRYEPSACNGIPIEHETVEWVEYFTQP